MGRYSDASDHKNDIFRVVIQIMLLIGWKSDSFDVILTINFENI